MMTNFAAIQKLIADQKLDAILVSSVANIMYVTGYAGFSQIEREAYLLLTNKKTYLFTDGRYSEAVKEHIPHIQLIESSTANPFHSNLLQIIQKEAIGGMGFEENDISVREYKQIKKLVSRLKPIDLRLFRITKTDREAGAIQHACAIGDNAFSHILSFIKHGITEQELALELELFIRKKGVTLSFPTIVAFGKNSAIPHHHTGVTKLMKNDIVLLDFGVRVNHYCSDMTRIVFVGRPTNPKRRVYEVVKIAQQQAIDELINQIKTAGKAKAAEIDAAARNYIQMQGHPTIPHSVGHGIGIEVHEAPTLAPNSKHILENGMVFSIEPGIYLPGQFGIRIEDLFAIQNNRVVPLTKASKDIIVL